MLRHLFAIVLLCLAAASAPGSAQKAESAVWGNAVMKQPFDTGVFRQVRIPEWVQETTGCGYTLSVMDSKTRARAAAHGVLRSISGA